MSLYSNDILETLNDNLKGEYKYRRLFILWFAFNLVLLMSNCQNYYLSIGNEFIKGITIGTNILAIAISLALVLKMSKEIKVLKECIAHIENNKQFIENVWN